MVLPNPPLLPVVAELTSPSAVVRAVRSGDEIVEEMYARNPKGKETLVLVSPTHPCLGRERGARYGSLIASGSGGLFTLPPTFGFTSARSDRHKMVLSGEENGWNIRKTITLGAGGEVDVSVRADTDLSSPRLRYLLTTYAFAPNGQPMSAACKPDSTWAPSIRPREDDVIGDHFFRSPAVVSQKGAISAVLMPDLDVLTTERAIPSVVDLDCTGNVVDAPLMSYGFADYRLVGHVYFANDSAMVRPVPWSLRSDMAILLSSSAAPYSATSQAADYLWAKYGSRYLGKILPQAMPFAEYANVCYPAALNEKETGGWFETDIDGRPCGGMASGWGRDQGWVSWQCWFNQLRSAWGMHWWARKLDNRDWLDKSDKMLNLALAAPLEHGACPTTYDSRNRGWKGSLIMPSRDCYYDLTNMAWKGIWLLRWLDFSDCPRADEVRRQCAEMARCMMRFQHGDGSFPTWLSKSLEPIPILSRSAQSALPGWFLAKLAKTAGFDDELAKRSADSARKCASFLASSIVDPKLYYDFETFFSCSPKQCLQIGDTLDDARMHDPYTLQAPQNTLSMQWTAEALRETAALEKPQERPKLMAAAIKALDTMCMYQNVWPISYRPVAYTYGGFGVQNSDGEYNDARQAQFAETLCDFGAELGRKDYFERGVAAARASLTLINHPLHEKFGIYPNPNYPLGLEPENCGHGGTNEQDGRTGFDWGEGSGLASMALLLDKYGPDYHASGWSVLVDGGTPKIEPAPSSGSLSFEDWHMPGWVFTGDLIPWPTRSARTNFGAAGKPFIGTCEDGRGGFDDTMIGTIISPEFVADKPTISLLVGGGRGDGEYVELLDSSGNRIAVEHGRNREEMDRRTWDVSRYQGQRLRIRIVDSEKEGWGHINVGDIRLE